MLRLHGRRVAIWNLAPLPRGRDWYHRLPCCGECSICHGHGCFVWAPDEDPRELHICWRGCDGLPPKLLGQVGAA
ncbi:MAG TPA: hypothetical protein VF940_30050 [Streptosporangiaceae bacterium]